MKKKLANCEQMNAKLIIKTTQWFPAARFKANSRQIISHFANLSHKRIKILQYTICIAEKRALKKGLQLNAYAYLNTQHSSFPPNTKHRLLSSTESTSGSIKICKCKFAMKCGIFSAFHSVF